MKNSKAETERIAEDNGVATDAVLSVLADNLQKYLSHAIALRQFHQDWKYSCFEQLLQQEGRRMHLSREAQDYPSQIAKACYVNALRMVEIPGINYCEGIAISEDINIPLFHAWNCDRSGRVIDTTWNYEKTVYWGVSFDTDWLIKFLLGRNRRDYLAVFDGNYLENFSLLRSGLPEAAICND